jgi:hypothetical protein
VITDPIHGSRPIFKKATSHAAMFCMAMRYTGDVINEPAFVLTDNTALIQSTNSYMGKPSTLLAWHNADPVDGGEELRNDRVYSLYQANRNPFVDHPDRVNLTFVPAHTNAPILNISRLANGVMVAWQATNQSCQFEFSTDSTLTW